MVTFLDRLVKGVRKNTELEEHRDLVRYSRAGIPVNILESRRIPRGIVPPVLDKEPARKKDYKDASINRIGDSQIFYFKEHHAEEEE